MDSILNVIEDSVKTAFFLSGYDRTYGKVTVSNRPDLCEYQSNGALSLAKTEKKPALKIAEEVAIRLSEMEMSGVRIFSKAEAVKPGFINIDISPDYISSYLNQMNFEECLGFKGNEGKRIIIDYGGANAAKPLHVGHLRSAVIGECIKRLARRMGNDVISDVHLGDWGLQMGLIMAELSERGELEKDITISELEEIYPKASMKAKEKNPDGSLKNESFQAKAHEFTKRLQDGDGECMEVWKRIMKVSKEDLKKNYSSLNVTFDLWKGESDAQKYIPGLIDDLVEKGLAYESDGALVVDIKEEGDSKEFPPCIVRKSDGAALYATSDLGTIIEREKLYSPDRYIYIADSRQSLHYTQFFRVARRAGFVPEERILDYIGFGTMNGRDGKPFKTRDGGVLRLERLISDTQEKVLERIKAEGRDTEDGEDISYRIALSALKYGDLSNQASKDYVFDMDRFTSFEGNTGPYILYTMVRIGSILRKYAEKEGLPKVTDTKLFCREKAVDFRINSPFSKEEKELSTALSRYQDELRSSWKDLYPHRICSYIYNVSNAFNSFYHNTNILKEEDDRKKKGYIGLIILTYRILQDMTDILGFEAPEKM